jgi:hypothetical protein
MMTGVFACDGLDRFIPWHWLPNLSSNPKFTLRNSLCIVFHKRDPDGKLLMYNAPEAPNQFLEYSLGQHNLPIILCHMHEAKTEKNHCTGANLHILTFMTVLCPELYLIFSLLVIYYCIE